MASFSSSDKWYEMISKSIDLRVYEHSTKLNGSYEQLKKIELVPTVVWYSVRSSVMIRLKQGADTE